GGQSRVMPVELVLVQGCPIFSPLSHVPVPGLAGGPVPVHLGHNASPTTNNVKFSETLREASPVARLSVPLAGCLNVLITQTPSAGRAAFGMGSGVPKLQPVAVQSGSAEFAAGL